MLDGGELVLDRTEVYTVADVPIDSWTEFLEMIAHNLALLSNGKSKTPVPPVSAERNRLPLLRRTRTDRNLDLFPTLRRFSVHRHTLSLDILLGVLFPATQCLLPNVRDVMASFSKRHELAVDPEILDAFNTAQEALDKLEHVLKVVIEQAD